MGASMRYVFTIAVCGLLSGCSYTPVVDLRASEDDAYLYQRDLMECRELAKDVDFSIFPQNHRAVARCLRGRGHTVIDDIGGDPSTFMTLMLNKS